MKLPSRKELIEYHWVDYINSVERNQYTNDNLFWAWFVKKKLPKWKEFITYAKSKNIEITKRNSKLLEKYELEHDKEEKRFDQHDVEHKAALEAWNTRSTFIRFWMIGYPNYKSFDFNWPSYPRLELTIDITCKSFDKWLEEAS